MRTCDTQLDKKHFININPKGTFENYNPFKVGPDWSKVQTSYTDVDAMFDHIRQGQKKHIALFFHGGLVGECNGMEAAERFYRFYFREDGIYPVGFVWETGFLPSLVEHFKEEASGGFFKAVFQKAAEKLLDKLGIQVPGLPDLPLGIKSKELVFMTNTALLEVENATLFEDKAEQYKDVPLEEIEMELLSEAPAAEQEVFLFQEWNTAQPMSKSLASPANIAIFGLKVAARCIYRFARKRNHGVLATVQEEVYRQIKLGPIGVEDTAIGIWDQMKKQADLMWKSNESRTGDHQYAGRYFLDKLSDYVKEVAAAGGEVKIELVGHSAGSIAICELFDLLMSEKAQYDHIRFNNVIFLAPACKCDLFYHTVMKMTDRFKKFRMFTMHQEVEEKDILVDVPYLTWLYPMSLLYFVSGLCEDGDKWFDEDVKGDTCILGLHQHIKGRWPYTKYGILNEVRQFLEHGGSNSNRLALVPSTADAPLGYRGRARDHGYFDNDGELESEYAGSIRESLYHLLNS